MKHKHFCIILISAVYSGLLINTYIFSFPLNSWNKRPMSHIAQLSYALHHWIPINTPPPPFVTPVFLPYTAATSIDCDVIHFLWFIHVCYMLKIYITLWSKIYGVNKLDSIQWEYLSIWNFFTILVFERIYCVKI